MRRTITTSFVLAALTGMALPAQQGTTQRTYIDVQALHALANSARLQAMQAWAAAQPALHSVEPTLAQARQAMESARLAMVALPPLDFDFDIPMLRFEQESDSVLWQSARADLNRLNYRRAAELFDRLIARYPRSAYVGDSYYWQAWALSRMGGTDNLQEAKALLETQKRRFASASTSKEGETLLIRIQTELARSGEAADAEAVTRAATRELQQQQCPQREDEEVRSAALNALIQMGSENAMPILKQIMTRKDACSAALRKRAIFLVSQQRSTEKEDILLEAARNDPDMSVRGDAVFWLGQVNTDKALAAIEAVLNASSDRAVQDKAIHALSQHRSPRAAQVLRAWAESDSRPAQPRERAIFWIGQQRDPENGVFLRTLYGRLPAGRLKEQVMFSLSQRSGEGNEKWLMDIAMNEQEDVSTRKKALFQAGQMRGVVIADLVTLYDRTTNREMKEQLIFVYSQRREKEALDKMIDIARKDRDNRLRERAIFWLGQSKDPRALAAIAEIIG